MRSALRGRGRGKGKGRALHGLAPHKSSVRFLEGGLVDGLDERQEWSHASCNRPAECCRIGSAAVPGDARAMPGIGPRCRDSYFSDESGSESESRVGHDSAASPPAALHVSQDNTRKTCSRDGGCASELNRRQSFFSDDEGEDGSAGRGAVAARSATRSIALSEVWEDPAAGRSHANTAQSEIWEDPTAGQSAVWNEARSDVWSEAQGEAWEDPSAEQQAVRSVLGRRQSREETGASSCASLPSPTFSLSQLGTGWGDAEVGVSFKASMVGENGNIDDGLVVCQPNRAAAAADLQELHELLCEPSCASGAQTCKVYTAAPEDVAEVAAEEHRQLTVAEIAELEEQQRQLHHGLSRLLASVSEQGASEAPALTRRLEEAERRWRVELEDFRGELRALRSLHLDAASPLQVLSSPTSSPEPGAEPPPAAAAALQELLSRERVERDAALERLEARVLGQFDGRFRLLEAEGVSGVPGSRSLLEGAAQASAAVPDSQRFIQEPIDFEALAREHVSAASSERQATLDERFVALEERILAERCEREDGLRAERRACEDKCQALGGALQDLEGNLDAVDAALKAEIARASEELRASHSHLQANLLTEIRKAKSTAERREFSDSSWQVHRGLWGGEAAHRSDGGSSFGGSSSRQAPVTGLRASSASPPCAPVPPGRPWSDEAAASSRDQFLWERTAREARDSAIESALLTMETKLSEKIAQVCHEHRSGRQAMRELLTEEDEAPQMFALLPGAAGAETIAAVPAPSLGTSASGALGSPAAGASALSPAASEG